jgi:hypothetical protein
MGIMICPILMKRKISKKGNFENGIEKIISREKPEMSILKKKECIFVSIILDYWWDDCSERLRLIELRNKVVGVNCDFEEEKEKRKKWKERRNEHDKGVEDVD